MINKSETLQETLISARRQAGRFMARCNVLMNQNIHRERSPENTVHAVKVELDNLTDMIKEIREKLKTL